MCIVGTEVRVNTYSVFLCVSVQEFASVCILSTLQSTLTLWSLRGLSLPMYVVFKRCLPLFTLSIGVCVLRNGVPSVGVAIAVLITTGGAALAGKHTHSCTVSPAFFTYSHQIHLCQVGGNEETSSSSHLILLS